MPLSIRAEHCYVKLFMLIVTYDECYLKAVYALCCYIECHYAQCLHAKCSGVWEKHSSLFGLFVSDEENKM
jgi:hypothetical protein